MNATFVNGTGIETGVPVQIHAGDKLRFGLVELQFESAWLQGSDRGREEGFKPSQIRRANVSS